MAHKQPVKYIEDNDVHLRGRAGLISDISFLGIAGVR
jgi:hypothetical protein